MKLNIKHSDFLKKIPPLPGVYRFYAENDDLLYIGKAINLHKRVKSYFQKKDNNSARINLLVKHIDKIEFTITENEVSAFILENNLIKSLKPKYNIIFRDDKSYPLIKISNHKYPRIDSYREKKVIDGSENNLNNKEGSYVFGPYPNALSVKHNIDLIQRLFKIRTCTDKFFANRKRPCMLYQVKRCTAPCVNYVSDSDYNKQVLEVVDFLEGKFAKVINDLTISMYKSAEQMEFEKSAIIRDKIAIIKEISNNQIINNYNKPISADIILVTKYTSKVFIYIIILRHGIYIGDNHFTLNEEENDLKNEILEVFLENYYLSGKNTKHIYIDEIVSKEFCNFFYNMYNIKLTKINLGNKHLKKLYDMAQLNLKKIIDDYIGDKNLEESAQILAKFLNLESVNYIECIDVSHNHGESALASIVVYENGKIENSKYKKYNIPAEVRGNDLLAFKTVLDRRLASLVAPLPEVLLLDGGVLHLNAVKNILIENGLYGKIRTAAIFKGDKRKPEFDKVVLDNGLILAANENKILFKLLHKLRDEAHRFAITGHRKKQIARMSISQLESIPNIGKEKRRALISYFGSVKNVANASVDDLKKVVGIGDELANQIYLHFH